MTATKRLSRTIQRVTNQARKLLTAGVAMTTITDDDLHASSSTISVARRFARWRGSAMERARTRVNASMARDGQPVRLSRAELDAGERGRGTAAGSAADPTLAGVLAVPLVARSGRALGVQLVADRDDGSAFDARDQAILESVAQLTAEIVDAGTSESRLQAILDHAPAAIFLKDRDLRYVVANAQAAELAGATSAAAMLGRTDAEFLEPGDAAEIMASDRLILEGGPDLDHEEVNRRRGREAVLHAQIFAVRDAFGRPSGIGGVVSDVSERRAAEAALAGSERRYRMLFEEAQDAILMADDEGRYLDANPAACAMLGMTRDEITARSVGDLMVSGAESWATYRARAAGTDAPAFAPGDLQMSRPDGAIVVAEYTVAPRLVEGVHVAILRDVTERRRREAETEQRQNVVAALRQLPPSRDEEAIAASICEAIVELGALAGAAIFAFEGSAWLTLLSYSLAADRQPVVMPVGLTSALVRSLRRRARDGAWVDDWTARSQTVTGIDLAQIDIRSSACVPLEFEGQVIGLLAVGDGGPAERLEARLTDLVEFADVASTLLGRPLVERARLRRERRRIRRTIDSRSFHPVFQPIVDLETGATVGYEGLTRFDDQTPPDRWFVAADAAGVGLDLEVATLTAILEASGPLPANRFLDVNVSPDLILAGEPLSSLLRDVGFNVVLEVTEHAAIDDYGALREAIAGLGDHVVLAVDDAGAGFASLRHIVELGPAFVKLDRALVAGIDRDPARQAMVAGLVEFADRLGTTLIAEGVEQEAERVTLLELKVRRAQGYLFARPSPVEVLMAARRSR